MKAPLIRQKSRLLEVGLCLAFALFYSAAPSRAATFTVTNLNDGGPGSFRQALADAELTGGGDSIQFNLPGPGPHTLQPLSPFPTITNSVTIDGYTQPGASVNTLAVGNNAVIKIRLSGLSAGAGADGLGINSSGCTVRGLAILDFAGDGIELLGPSDTLVRGNFIGLDVDGLTVRPNAGAGIRISSNSADIGGRNPDRRNVISGNVAGGVVISGSDNNKVFGNYIGTDASGISWWRRMPVAR